MCNSDKFTWFCIKKRFKVAIGLMLSVFALVSSLSSITYFVIVSENQKLRDEFPAIDEGILTAFSLYILSFVLFLSSWVITFKTCHGLTKYSKKIEESLLEEPYLSRLLIFVFALLGLSYVVLLLITVVFMSFINELFRIDFKEGSNKNIMYVIYATFVLSHVIVGFLLSRCSRQTSH